MVGGCRQGEQRGTGRGDCESVAWIEADHQDFFLTMYILDDHIRVRLSLR